MFLKAKNILNLIKGPLDSVRVHGLLLKEFVVRDLKGRFAGSIAGFLWTFINPALNIMIYFFLFSLVIKVRVSSADTGTDSFAIFFLTGMFPWLMFSEGLLRSAGSVLDNAGLVTKVVFPVELLPISAVISAFTTNGIGMLLFMVYLAFAGFLHYKWILLLVVFGTQMVFTGGIALLVSAVTVFIRDIREILGIGLMVWFYATPIIYPISMVPNDFRKIIEINPVTIFVEGFRYVLLMHKLPIRLAMILIVMAIFSYVIGAWFFMRARPAFGDVL